MQRQASFYWVQCQSDVHSEFYKKRHCQKTKYKTTKITTTTNKNNKINEVRMHHSDELNYLTKELSIARVWAEQQTGFNSFHTLVTLLPLLYHLLCIKAFTVSCNLCLFLQTQGLTDCSHCIYSKKIFACKINYKHFHYLNSKKIEP